jgi:hypothetical protein
VVAVASSAAVCASAAGPVRQIAGLILIGALAFAVWFMHGGRFDAIVPTVGLTLVFLILAGLALAAVHVLSTVPVALAAVAATLATALAGAAQPTDVLAQPTDVLAQPPDVLAEPTGGLAERRAGLKPAHLFAVTGAVIFAAATVLAVRYSAADAAADADGASSLAIWAYPSGGQLHVGVEQPAGRAALSLRIVVTEAGVTVATWNDIRLNPGQTWEAPAFTVTGNGPARVVALHGGTVVASLSSR